MSAQKKYVLCNRKYAKPIFRYTFSTCFCLINFHKTYVSLLFGFGNLKCNYALARCDITLLPVNSSSCLLIPQVFEQGIFYDMLTLFNISINCSNNHPEGQRHAKHSVMCINKDVLKATGIDLRKNFFPHLSLGL